MGKQAGVRKVDTVVWKDGTRIDIKLDVSDGVFVSSLESDGRTIFTLREKDLGTLKGKLREKENEYASFSWKPVIIVTSSRPNDSWIGNHVCQHSIDFEYERVFRAECRDGSFKYAEFVPKETVPPVRSAIALTTGILTTISAARWRRSGARLTKIKQPARWVLLRIAPTWQTVTGQSSWSTPLSAGPLLGR